MRTAAGRRFGQRMALFARGAVGEKAHRVEGLPGAAGADHDALPGQVALRRSGSCQDAAPR